jgi:hypothetical protein
VVAAGGKVFLLEVQLCADAVELCSDVATGVIELAVSVNLGLQLPVAEFLNGFGEGEEGSAWAL